MKTFVAVVVLFTLSHPARSQKIEIDSVSSKYAASGVIPVDSLSKNQLFSAAKEWITRSYRNANDVIQLTDKETGKIICKGNFSSNLFLKQGWIRHTLILEFKDKRFRYTYTDFSYYSSGSGEMIFEKSMMAKKKVIAETEGDVRSSIDSFVKSLSSKKGADW